MESTIEMLYKKLFKQPDFSEEEKYIKENFDEIKRIGTVSLQRKLILSIIDKKDLICWGTGVESFRQGLVIGMTLAKEIENSGALEEPFNTPLLNLNEEGN